MDRLQSSVTLNGINKANGKIAEAISWLFLPSSNLISDLRQLGLQISFDREYGRNETLTELHRVCRSQMLEYYLAFPFTALKRSRSGGESGYCLRHDRWRYAPAAL